MDAVWVIFSLAFITTIRPALSYFSIFAVIPPPYNLPWVLYLIFPLTWVGILLFVSVYDKETIQSILNLLTKITLGSVTSGIFLAGLLYLSFRDISRFLYLLFFLLTYLGLLGWRLIARLLLKNKTRVTRKRKVLIIGDNDTTRELSENLSKTGLENPLVVTLLDENFEKSESLINVGEKVILEDFQEIIISVTQVNRMVLNDLIGRLHCLPVRVWVIPDYFQLTLHKAVFSELAGFPMLDLRAPALSFNQRIIKRAFDILVSLLSFPFFCPAMIIAAVWIRIDSPGPVLLRQRRVGENGAIFYMYKFRTMISNAEELRSLVEYHDGNGNLIHKNIYDPRVTKAGRFLRRWSLDEIPQIFNVLKGEMSLVGPRPELPYLVDQYEPWQRQRFSIPQGITGWWQINGRSNKPMHLNTADDIYYVQNYSMLLDISILFKTINVVIKGKGAF
jgi:exopolysaccharide biosynthesis polyprenyl glycosylphosphotransferase